MKQRFTKIMAALALLVCVFLPLGMRAAEGDVHDMNITQSTNLNNNAAIPSINIAAQTYTVKTVTINWRYNKTIENPVTIEVLVGGTSWGTQTITGNTTADAVFNGESTNGAIVINFTNNTGSGTGHGTFYVNSVKLTEGEGSGPAPTYTVTYNAGGGSGTMTDSNSPYTAGTTVTLLTNSFTAPTGYGWSGWDVKDASNNTVTVSNNQFTMPASNVTVTAQWEAIGPNFTYVFSDATKFYTDAALNTNVPTGNTSSVGTFYYENGDMFTAAGTNRYFGAGSNNYFFIGKTGATLTLPTYEGYKITRIIIHNSSGCSQSVSVEVANGTNTASNAQTWTVRNQDYTYNIDAAYQTSALTVKITNDYNAQITSITVVREEINSNRVATPTFNPNGGIITEDTDVTISCETEEATIYYTLDGTTPTINSAVYSQAIPVSATTTIKAIAVKSGMDNSYEAEASYTRKYTITVNQPALGGTITASPLQAEAGNLITLNATPNEGYTFGEWSITPNVSMNGNSFEMPASNVTVSATFNQRPSFTITFTTNGFNDGSMQVYQGDAITTLPEATAAYIPEGYAFVGWYTTDYEDASVAPHLSPLPTSLLLMSL